jgi:hypothetical protein
MRDGYIGRLVELTQGRAGDLLLIGSYEPLASRYVGLTPQHSGVVTVYGGDTEPPSHREPPRRGGAVRTGSKRKNLGHAG